MVNLKLRFQASQIIANTTVYQYKVIGLLNLDKDSDSDSGWQDSDLP